MVRYVKGPCKNRYIWPEYTDMMRSNK